MDTYFKHWSDVAGFARGIAASADATSPADAAIELWGNDKDNDMTRKHNAIHIDSFSGPASDLKPSQRHPQAVLKVLAHHPRLSTWDMSEHAWLRGCINTLERSKQIVSVTEMYPWHRWELTDAGRLAVIGGAQ